MSVTSSTWCWANSARNRSSGCVEWPMVKSSSGMAIPNERRKAAAVRRGDSDVNGSFLETFRFDLDGQVVDAEPLVQRIPQLLEQGGVGLPFSGDDVGRQAVQPARDRPHMQVMHRQDARRFLHCPVDR